MTTITILIAACLAPFYLPFLIFRTLKYRSLEKKVFKKLDLTSWDIAPHFDDHEIVKSRRALENFDDVKYFKSDKDRLGKVESTLNFKNDAKKKLESFLKDNEFQKRYRYKKIKKNAEEAIKNASAYRVEVTYITTAGNNKGQKEITITKSRVKHFKDNPALLMTKSEYNKYVKEKNKEVLDKKHHDYYDKVNAIVDCANTNKDQLVIKGSGEKLDDLITKLFDRCVNSIKKIKTIDSEEWDIIGDFISQIKNDVEQIIKQNQKILDYYKSDEFAKVKKSCETLMGAQKEFNEYIDEKVQAIAGYFGSRVVRTDTTHTDTNNYIRPYKKTITPFTAEVSSTVFASAENNPMAYIVKNFYLNKQQYPESIKKLHSLVEELETLKDAKKIIETYKKDYQKYLVDVPAFVMENDESGFYSRLGFAYIDESALTIEYKFSYTSGGGMAQRSFTVPMTEETIVELINTLENKLTLKAFAKEQRNLMTTKLRETIKKRDNFTCCMCGNSTEKEPNLLLEIDHIVPVSKGGCTVEDNLQTLCWKCNRSKSNKLLESAK